MLLHSLNMSEEEKKKIIRDADNMINGKYIFDGIWDMEPCSIPIDNKDISWDIMYNGDNEWAYMFVRMDYLYKLIVATDITGKTEYLKHGLRIINKWYHDNNKHVFYELKKPYRFLFRFKKDCWLAIRTIDVAIMNSNIVDFIMYCKEYGILNEKVFFKYRRIVINNILYIAAYSDGDRKAFSNWGIIENGNIIYCLLKLDSTIMYSEVMSRFIRQVNNQITHNGSQVESSPMYLVQILLVILKVLNINNCNNREDLIAPATKGCEYIAGIRSLNNNIPNIGDSDVTNISDLMIIAAKVLNNNWFLQFADRRITVEYAVKYNIIRDVELNCYKNSTDNSIIKHRDQTVFRSDNKQSYLLCSNIPRRVDGHKHYDYLSVLYSEYGKDVLVDLGRFSYKDDEKRKISLGPSAHNVICVEGNTYYESISSWVTKQRVDCFDNVVLENEEWISVKMSCVIGYSEITMKRYVTYVFDKGLIITDIVSDSKGNDYLTYFNIGISFNVETDDSFIRIYDENNSMSYYNDSGVSITLNRVMYSPKYNEEFEINQIMTKSNKKNLTHFILKSKERISTEYSEEFIKYSFDGSNYRICIPY